MGRQDHADGWINGLQAKPFLELALKLAVVQNSSPDHLQKGMSYPDRPVAIRL